MLSFSPVVSSPPRILGPSSYVAFICLFSLSLSFPFSHVSSKRTSGFYSPPGNYPFPCPSHLQLVWVYPLPQRTSLTFRTFSVLPCIRYLRPFLTRSLSLFSPLSLSLPLSLYFSLSLSLSLSLPLCLSSTGRVGRATAPEAVARILSTHGTLRHATPRHATRHYQQREREREEGVRCKFSASFNHPLKDSKDYAVTRARVAGPETRPKRHREGCLVEKLTGVSFAYFPRLLSRVCSLRSINCYGER